MTDTVSLGLVFFILHFNAGMLHIICLMYRHILYMSINRNTPYVYTSYIYLYIYVSVRSSTVCNKFSSCFVFGFFLRQTQNIMWLYTVAEHSADRNISIYNAYTFHGRGRYFITDTLFQCVAII